MRKEQDGEELRERRHTRRSEPPNGVRITQQFLDPVPPCREQPVRPRFDPTVWHPRGLGQFPGSLPIEPGLEIERVNAPVFTDREVSDLVSDDDGSPQWSHPLEPWDLYEYEIIRLVGAARVGESSEQEISEGQRARYEVVGSAW